MENTTLLPALEVTNPISSATPSADYEDYYNESYFFQDTPFVNTEDYNAGYSSQGILWRRLNILSLVIYSLAFVLGVTGNGLVIFITGFHMKKTVSVIWFLNLAIADFTFTFFLPLRVTYVALKFDWLFGEPMCKFYSTLTFINLYASIFLLTVISIDRCISVRCPVWARNHRTPRLASFVASGVWILAFVLSSPYIRFEQIKWDGRVMKCRSNFTAHEYLAVVISRFILAFAIPFMVIIVCYGAIVRRLKRDRLAPSRKPFKVITAVIVAFFVCWLPYHIFSFLETRVHYDPTLYFLLISGRPLVYSLAFINSCLNPILYVFMGHDFKQRLRHSFFLIFENAFSEEVSPSTVKSSIELDSHPL